MSGGDWLKWINDGVVPLTADEIAEHDASDLAGKRGQRCVHILEMLSSIRWSDASEAKKSDAGELLKVYAKIVGAYYRHDGKHERGWSIPSPEDVMNRNYSEKAIAGGRKFTVSLFREKELPVIEGNVRVGAAACCGYTRREPGTGVMGMRKLLNSTFILFELEFDSVSKVMKHL